MDCRQLGNSSLHVSRIGLGTATFGREIDEADSFDLMDHALANGIQFFDTAENYGAGQAKLAREREQGFRDSREVGDEFHSSELNIGRWLKSRRCRDRIILQTKLLPPLTESRITTLIDESLARLQTDHVDLYLAHAFDPATPLEESLDAFARIKQAGKTREVGCSNFDAGQLQRAIDLRGITPLAAVQSNYNLAVRDIERDLLPLCQANRIGVQTYSPLGAGFLTGKYSDPAHEAPKGARFDVAPGHAAIYFHPEKFQVVKRLLLAAETLSIPAPQLAVAWVLANPLVDCVLIGARKRSHIDSALTAMSISNDVVRNVAELCAVPS